MPSDENLNNFYNILYIMCRGEPCDHAFLEEKCREITSMPSFSESAPYIDEVIDRYERTYGSKTFVPPVVLSNYPSNDSWLFSKKERMSDEDHAYQKRYSNYLIYEKKYGEQSTQHIFSDAESILSYCADPNAEGSDQRFGLVMGDVQSGKTSSYLALANMALDYGYRIILILSGTTESLRVQTQKRIDAGLVGAVSSTIGNIVKYTGLGKGNSYYAIPLSDDQGDFKPPNCSSEDFKLPQIIVAKKNKSVLEKIKSWLKPNSDPRISSDNILIIDDECDYASLNTRKDEENPTAINGLIREIFNNFTHASYVGYTATPFANIFVKSDNNPDALPDLFPKDFIIRLRTTNENYFGINKVFRDDDRYIYFLDNHEPLLLPTNHKKNDVIGGIPESLKDAICVFLLCNCVRTLRGDQKEHRSMMINISRFNNIHSQLETYVKNYVEMLKITIFQYDRYTLSRFLKNPECKRLYDLYSDHMFDKARSQGFDFERVKRLLDSEIKLFEVLVINESNPKNKLDYDNDKYEEKGARLIVIGGFTLSRGLTLEGLMVSYYHRNANAYDTLLQMARWFGYRENYEDLCKIYVSEDNYNNFETVITAIDDLDEQLEYMNSQGSAPGEYGLMIMQSPDVLETKLLVTSRNKSRNSKSMTLSLNFSGADIDTPHLYTDAEKIIKNAKAVKKFTDKINQTGIHLETLNNRNMYKNVPCNLIAEFIRSIDIPPQNRKFIINNLSPFIEKGERYKNWDVVYATGDPSDGGEKFDICDDKGNVLKSIFAPHRSFDSEEGSGIITTSTNNHNRLNDPGLFNSGLTQQQLDEAQQIADERTKKPKTDRIAKDYLAVKGRNPLLIIYPLILKADKTSKDKTPSPYKQKIIDAVNKCNCSLYGFGIGFPGTIDDRISSNYLVNDIKLKELYNSEDDGLEDEDE